MFDADSDPLAYKALLSSGGFSPFEWEGSEADVDSAVSPVDVALLKLVRDVTPRLSKSRVRSRRRLKDVHLDQLKELVSPRNEFVALTHPELEILDITAAGTEMVVFEEVASSFLTEEERIYGHVSKVKQLTFPLGGDFVPSKELVRYWVRGVEATAAEAAVRSFGTEGTVIDGSLQRKFAEEVISLFGTIGQQLRHESEADVKITKGGRFGLVYQMQLSEQFFIIPDEVSAFLSELKEEITSAILAGSDISGTWGKIELDSTGDLCYKLQPLNIVRNESFVRARSRVVAARFTYIQLSDVHFCTQPGRHNLISLMARRPRDYIDTCLRQAGELGFESLAKPVSFSPKIVSGVAQFCYQRSQQNDVDGILFTGDLATTGMMTDIGVGRRFISEPARNGYVTDRRLPTLSAANLPIYVVPGNHDKYVDNVATPNCPHFELVFEMHMPNLSHGTAHKVCKKQENYLGFVFADFCLRSRDDATEPVSGPYGQGRVYRDTLEQLRARTLLLRQKYRSISVVWVIHFAPFECGDSPELLDRNSVLDAARSLHVTCMLCGHTHRMSKFQVDDHITYCAGSAGCVDSEDDSRLHVLHFDIGDGLRVTRENYRWNWRDAEFRAYSED